MNPHLDRPVLYFGREVRLSRAVTVLVHGRGGTPEAMLEIARRLELPEMAFVAVSAAGQSWYPRTFLSPIEENQPWLDDALYSLLALVRQLEQSGKSRGDIAFLGFSQGACLASELLYRQGGRWGGLVALTGGLIGPAETAWPLERSLAGTPVFLGTGDPDPWVPLTRVRQTAAVFARLDAQVELEVYPGREHLVSDDEVVRSRRLLDGIGR